MRRIILHIYGTSPVSYSWCVLLLVLAIIYQVIGDGHWSATAFMAGLQVVWFVATKGHIKRLDELKATHEKELQSFGSFLLQRRTKNVGLQATEHDLRSWRTSYPGNFQKQPARGEVK
jgi:hypothetical protein